MFLLSNYCGVFLVTNLLRRIIVSSTISFCVGFRVDKSNYVRRYTVDLKSKKKKRLNSSGKGCIESL